MHLFALFPPLQVGDRCGECEDDHIDILMDRPVSYAPWSPSSPGENNHAQYVNALPGRHGGCSNGGNSISAAYCVPIHVTY